MLNSYVLKEFTLQECDRSQSRGGSCDSDAGVFTFHVVGV